MKKKMLACVLIMVLALMSFSVADAAVMYSDGTSVTFHNESPWYIVNDAWVQGQYPAQRVNGVLYVSIADFSAAIGCHTEYNSSDNSVYVEFAEKSIWQGVGYTGLYVDGVAYENPAPYIAENGAVMVPAEPYASVIGYNGEFVKTAEYSPGQLTLKIPQVECTIKGVEINQAAQLVTIYGTDPAGNRRELKHFLCSTGLGGATPNGTFQVNPLGSWYYFSKYGCYVMYCSQVVGDVCFHSIPFNGNYYDSMSRTGYAALGNPASHGCIRLLAEDAKFIYQNCAYLPVTISWGYTNEKTDAIRNQLLGAKLSYENYVEMLKSGDF